jgi:methyltransferase (TIGR00027 family)
MREGRASRTSELVCMGRAIEDGLSSVVTFRDPTARTLLPEQQRTEVDRIRTGIPPDGLRARLARSYHLRLSKVMVARTVVIDEAIRDARPRQVVILGAGLDGRAWRMQELRNAAVFEVDHPDTQREKRARVGSLTQMAERVRFVPVDFERDALDDALGKAGHDPSVPTTWVWEGVVMYLDLSDVQKTLAVVGHRSAPESRVIILYHAPAPVLRLVGLFVGWLGEPLRSEFTAPEMRKLLTTYGFSVLQDSDLRTLGKRFPVDIAEATDAMKHMRIVTAERARTGEARP